MRLFFLTLTMICFLPFANVSAEEYPLPVLIIEIPEIEYNLTADELNQPGIRIPSFSEGYQNQEYEPIQAFSQRYSSFERNQNTRNFRNNLIRRLPNMCLIAPTSFDGDWGFGCLYHFKPQPVLVNLEY